MAKKNEAKIIGGFLIGAGVITYLLATKKGKELTEHVACDAKKLASEAGEKVEEAKDSVNSFADKVMDFVVEHRPMVENAVSYLIGTVSGKK